MRETRLAAIARPPNLRRFKRPYDPTLIIIHRGLKRLSSLLDNARRTSSTKGYMSDCFTPSANISNLFSNLDEHLGIEVKVKHRMTVKSHDKLEYALPIPRDKALAINSQQRPLAMGFG